MFMRCGHKAVLSRDGPMGKNEMTVPYENLPEVEKDYDRDTAIGTLKLIVKLGFKISKL